MISYYNCRPGPPVSWKLFPPDRKTPRWILQRNTTGRRWLLEGDAQEIAALIRTSKGETLFGVATELSVTVTFLRAMLAAHGEIVVASK